jgi:hypothetical protein
MFEKSYVEEEINWTSLFDSILESMYFFDHLNLKKKNSSFLIISFENVSLEVINMLYLLEQSCSFIKLKRSENHLINNDFEASYQANSSTNKSKLAMSSLGILLNTNTDMKVMY